MRPVGLDGIHLDGDRCAVCDAPESDGRAVEPFVVDAASACGVFRDDGVEDVPAAEVGEHVRRWGGDRRVWREGAPLCCVCCLAAFPIRDLMYRPEEE